MDEEEREEMTGGLEGELEWPGATAGSRRDRFPRRTLILAVVAVAAAAAAEAWD